MHRLSETTDSAQSVFRSLLIHFYDYFPASSTHKMKAEVEIVDAVTRSEEHTEHSTVARTRPIFWLHLHIGRIELNTVAKLRYVWLIQSV